MFILAFKQFVKFSEWKDDKPSWNYVKAIKFTDIKHF